MTDLPLLSASELTRGLAEGEISSRDLLEQYLARVEALEPKVGAVVTVDPDPARERADAARARGESWGALHWLPSTVNDCWETELALDVMAGPLPDAGRAWRLELPPA